LTGSNESLFCLLRGAPCWPAGRAAGSSSEWRMWLGCPCCAVSPGADVLMRRCSMPSSA